MSHHAYGTHGAAMPLINPVSAPGTAVTPPRAEDPSIAVYTPARDVMGNGSLLPLPSERLPPTAFAGDVIYKLQEHGTART
jgi:hypothetical protein